MNYQTPASIRRPSAGITLGGALALLLAAAAPQSSAAPPPPNLLFILMDDLRWDEIGCGGQPFARTPNIDRLAREGAQFRNAFVTTPLCSPSRASYLTGRYAHSHGILDNTDRSALSHQLKTYPQLIHNAGYETGFIGKWHMGVDDSPRPGFDYWLTAPRSVGGGGSVSKKQFPIICLSR